MKSTNATARAMAIGLAAGMWLAASGFWAQAQQLRLPGLEPEAEQAIELDSTERPGQKTTSTPKTTPGSQESQAESSELGTASPAPAMHEHGVGDGAAPVSVEPSAHVAADASGTHDQESGHAAHEEAGHDTGHGHGGEVDTNPLTFKTDLALWTGVVFLVLLGVLWKFAWGPIIQGLDKRERGIADQIAQAEQQNAEAKKLLEQYDEKLARAQDEVRQIVEAGRRDAEQTGRELIEKAQADAESERQRALRDIDAATAAALQSLAEQSATLAVDLAGKIVGEKLDPEAHSRLIGQAVNRFVDQKPSEN